MELCRHVKGRERERVEQLNSDLIKHRGSEFYGQERTERVDGFHFEGHPWNSAAGHTHTLTNYAQNGSIKE